MMGYHDDVTIRSHGHALLRDLPPSFQVVTTTKVGPTSHAPMEGHWEACIGASGRPWGSGPDPTLGRVWSWPKLHLPALS